MTTAAANNNSENLAQKQQAPAPEEAAAEQPADQETEQQQQPVEEIAQKKTKEQRPEQEQHTSSQPAGGEAASEAAAAVVKTAEELRNDMLDTVIKGLFDCVDNRKNPKNTKVDSSGVLNPVLIIKLLNEAKESFASQPMLLQVSAPLCVVGDIHGQFTDLVYILNLIGHPPYQKYLFLGDYVDRGPHSIETFILLACLKMRYPDKFYLLRGNHECQSINKLYGFLDECKKKYNTKIWKKFGEAFEYMPVAAIIDEKIFCAHGGISHHLNDLNQINRIDRPCDVPDKGLLCDLLWSDPEEGIKGYHPNDRGVSFVFGYNVIQSFNQKFGFDLICRAHQIEEQGFAFHANRQLLTIFSAQNYCGEFNNSAAVLIIDEELFCVINKIEQPNTKKIKNVDKDSRRKSLGL